MDQQPSFSERLFWPAICLAVLALGGIGTIVHKIVARHSAPALIASADPKAAKAASPTSKSSANQEMEDQQVVDPASQNVAGTEAASDTETPLPEISSVVAVAAVQPAANMEEESPYVVPDRKPFISRETFAPPPRPAPPKKAVAKTPPPPAKTPVAAVKPAPATPAVQAGDAKKAALPPLSGISKPPVYVMRDGRKIAAIKVVDLGDSYGLKSTNGQIITVLKEDVTEIQK